MAPFKAHKKKKKWFRELHSHMYTKLFQWSGGYQVHPQSSGFTDCCY